MNISIKQIFYASIKCRFWGWGVHSFIWCWTHMLGYIVGHDCSV